MKKVRILSLLLVFVLLTGCVPAVSQVTEPAETVMEPVGTEVPEAEETELSVYREQRPIPTPKPPEPELVEPLFDNGFTTGNLDVDLRLKEIIEATVDPDAEFVENLHELYRHVRDNYKYRKMPLHTSQEAMEDWVFGNVEVMLEDGCGNCYSYAGLLYCLFRAYGFEEATMCIGSFTAQGNPHAWVKAVIDDVEYLFDVETEYASLARNRWPDHWVDCFYKTRHDLKAYDYGERLASQPVGNLGGTVATEEGRAE